MVNFVLLVATFFAAMFLATLAGLIQTTPGV